MNIFKKGFIVAAFGLAAATIPEKTMSKPRYHASTISPTKKGLNGPYSTTDNIMLAIGGGVCILGAACVALEFKNKPPANK